MGTNELIPMEIVLATLLLTSNSDLLNTLEFTYFMYFILNACQSHLLM